MPEGDTLHKLSRALEPRLLGRQMCITRLRGAPAHARLPSGRVEAVEALGKHLLIRIAGADGRGQLLRTHLGLWGGWHQYAPGEAWRKPARQAWVVLEADDAVFVCFTALNPDKAPFRAPERFACKARACRRSHSSAKRTQHRRRISPGLPPGGSVRVRGLRCRHLM
jgi:formamidopyrimidine-DNA glycosylase